MENTPSSVPEEPPRCWAGSTGEKKIYPKRRPTPPHIKKSPRMTASSGASRQKGGRNQISPGRHFLVLWNLYSIFPWTVDWLSGFLRQITSQTHDLFLSSCNSPPPVISSIPVLFNAFSISVSHFLQSLRVSGCSQEEKDSGPAYRPALVSS